MESSRGTGSGPGDVFVVGSPRSGTTWLHAVLTHLPDVVCPDETDVFVVLAAAHRSWAESQTLAGLKLVIALPEYEEWLAELWQRVRTSLLEACPTATYVIEKTPVHVNHIDLIRRLVPHPRFIVVARDPRDVVRSLLHARDTWGNEWAPPDVERAVDLWLHCTRGGLASAKEPDTLLVRYEALREGEAEWRRVLEFLGYPDFELPDVGLSPQEISAGRAFVLEGGQLVRSPLKASAPENFTYHTRGDARPRSLTGLERRYIEFRCAHVMRELGYDGARSRLGLADRIALKRRRMMRARERVSA